jgi:outer membrane protein OmpA-like peptidoglycan-associated protein
MHFFNRSSQIVISVILLALAHSAVRAQEGLGPLMPHEGGSITTAWTNSFGPDAESWIRFSKVGVDAFDINYSSSRGTVAIRRVRVSDRMTARTMVLGYNAKMPLVIENTTSLGTSAAVLEELRTTGQASSSLIYNTSLATIPGVFTHLETATMAININNQMLEVPVVHAKGEFRGGSQQASGDFYFLDNKNNPLLIEYTIQFKGEKTPRTERYVQISPGAAERGKLEQTLAARQDYITRGIHFDFDKASIRNDSDAVLGEIATALLNNPLWSLRIAGHTDSIGKAGYNEKLSERRANSVKAQLVKLGVAPDRLTTAGAGPSEPVASNKTLQGRALNRRVVLTRTDR